MGCWYEFLLGYSSVGAWMSRLGSLDPRQFYLMDVGDEVGSGYAVGEVVYLVALPNHLASQFRRCVLDCLVNFDESATRSEEHRQRSTAGRESFSTSARPSTAFGQK